MRVDVGNNTRYFFDSSKRNLNQASGPFEELFSFVGRGQLIEANFKFEKEKFFFQMEIDGETIIDIDIIELNDFFSFSNKDDNFNQRTSIVFEDSKNILSIKFPLPIQFNESVRFLAKTNEGNKEKEFRGYSVTINNEGEQS